MHDNPSDTLPASTYALEIRRPGSEVERHEVTAPIVIGRRPDGDGLMLSVPELSKSHLEVRPDMDGVRIRDLGSKNGTTINGRRLRTRPQVVRPGDQVVLGGAVTIVVRRLGLADDTLPQVVDQAVNLISSSDPQLAGELRDRMSELAMHRDALAWAGDRLPRLHRCSTLTDRLRVLVDETRTLSKAVVWAVAWEGDLGAGPVHYRHLVHDGDTIDLPEPGGIAQSIMGEAVRTGRPLWSEDARTDARFAEAKSVQLMGLRSVGCIPLGERAVLYLSNKEVAGVFRQAIRARVEALCQAARSWLDVPDEAFGVAEPTEPPMLPGVIGVSPAMRQVVNDVLTFAQLPYTILILGPRGSGKSHLAKSIHELSQRTGAFVHASIVDQPKELVPDALFGHRAGAFTGARRPRQGWAQMAQDGTLLLDEIGDLAPEVQPSLLTMLQERTFQPVGDDRRYPFTGRVIAATNQPIDQPELCATPFRRDLFDRLAEVVIRIPPLSERPGDIPLLARHFFTEEQERFRSAGANAPEAIGEDTLGVLRNATFDGNVRGLRAAVVRAMATAAREQASVVRPAHVSRLSGAAVVSADGLDFETALDNYRRQLMLDAYAKADGKQIRAAEILGINNQKWHRLRHRLGLKLGGDD